MADIEIRTLDAALAEDGFALASCNFATQSALHVALAANVDEYRAYLRPTFFDDVDEGLSLAAMDAASGNLVGVLIVRDFLKQRFADPLPFQQKFDPVTDLFEALEASYLQDRDLVPGQALLIDMAAVAPSPTSTRSGNSPCRSAASSRCTRPSRGPVPGPSPSPVGR